MGHDIVNKLYQDGLPNTPPKGRRGVLEQIAVMYSHTLDAVIKKNQLQLEKAKDRRAQAGFVKKDSKSGGASLGSGMMFVGTREQAMEALAQAESGSNDKDDE